MEPIAPQPQQTPPLQVTQTPVIVHPKHHSLVGGIAIALGAGLAIAAGYLLFNNYFPTGEEAVPVATSTPDSTAGWKTYTNTQYGFEFRYPSNLISKEASGTDGSGKGNFQVKLDTKENIEFQCEGCDGPSTFFMVSHYEYKGNVLQNCSPSAEPGYQLSKIMLDGLLVNKCVSNGLNGPNLAIHSSNDGITYDTIYADNYEGERKVLIDKIVSTFKFTGDQTVCTADAMRCPDGSYVGRTGPNCQFVCP